MKWPEFNLWRGGVGKVGSDVIEGVLAVDGVELGVARVKPSRSHVMQELLKDRLCLGLALGIFSGVVAQDSRVEADGEEGVGSGRGVIGRDEVGISLNSIHADRQRGVWEGQENHRADLAEGILCHFGGS
jgi:hypothetical protein